MWGFGGGYGRAVIRPLLAVVPGVLLAVTACAPGTPDEDSWRVDALRAVGDVSSSVGTMRLALEHRGDLFHPYLEAVAVRSEDSASASAQKLSSRQPPDAYLSRYETVTDALDAANSLLSDVRIAVVRRHPQAYADLLSQLGRTDHRLSTLEDDLRALPDDRSVP